MAIKSRTQPRPTQSALNALNALPKNIQVSLTRSLTGEWECDLSRKVGRNGWIGLPYYGEGRTANAAAAAMLAQYHGNPSR